MLETVRSAIANQRNAPDFDTFYMEYMLSVQDQDLRNEIDYLFRKNTIDASNLSILIEEDYKKMVDNYDVFN